MHPSRVRRATQGDQKAQGQNRTHRFFSNRPRCTYLGKAQAAPSQQIAASRLVTSVASGEAEREPWPCPYGPPVADVPDCAYKVPSTHSQSRTKPNSSTISAMTNSPPSNILRTVNFRGCQCSGVYGMRGDRQGLRTPQATARGCAGLALSPGRPAISLRARPCPFLSGSSA